MRSAAYAEDALKKHIKKIQSLNQRYIKENIAKTREVQELKIHSDPYELLDMFTSLLNLTVIENAPQTNELLSSFIAYIKYKYSDKGTFVINRAMEVEQAERLFDFSAEKAGRPPALFDPDTKRYIYPEDAFGRSAAVCPKCSI